MSNKMIITVMTVVVWLLLFSQESSAMEKETYKTTKPEDAIEDFIMPLPKQKEDVGMKVNFYRFNKEKNERGEYLGYAELKGGKLIFEVRDRRLEKMLKGDYYTIITLQEAGKEMDKQVIYKVGTKEHLEKVIENCKHISCIGETVKD